MVCVVPDNNCHATRSFYEYIGDDDAYFLHCFCSSVFIFCSLFLLILSLLYLHYFYASYALWTLWRIFVCARRTGPARAVCFCLLLLYHYDECFYEVAAMRLEIELRPYIAAS